MILHINDNEVVKELERSELFKEYIKGLVRETLEGHNNYSKSTIEDMIEDAIDEKESELVQSTLDTIRERLY